MIPLYMKPVSTNLGNHFDADKSSSCVTSYWVNSAWPSLYGLARWVPAKGGK